MYTEYRIFSLMNHLLKMILRIVLRNRHKIENEISELQSGFMTGKGTREGSVNVRHHHNVSSVVNRSAVMDLHRSRSCATLMQSLYDIFAHSWMLSVHIVLFYQLSFLPSAIVPHLLLLYVQNIDIYFFDSI